MLASAGQLASLFVVGKRHVQILMFARSVCRYNVELTYLPAGFFRDCTSLDAM